MQWLFTAHNVSRLHPFTSSTPSIAVHGSYLPVNSDRFGFGTRDCALRLQTLYDGYTSSAVIPKPRLLSRVVDDGMLHFLLQSHVSHTDSHIPPTHRGRGRQHSSLGIIRESSATLTPPTAPGARCDNALTPLRQSANHFTHSELPTA